MEPIEKPKIPFLSTPSQPATWQEMCAFFKKLDQWMRDMSTWADKVQKIFDDAAAGGEGLTPPKPPPPDFP